MPVLASASISGLVGRAIAVGAEAIGAQRIDEHEDDVQILALAQRRDLGRRLPFGRDGPASWNWLAIASTSRTAAPAK